ncbi:transketolase C-terminal domain-containing protein [Stratiformator vulcanicus]|uniref:Transketolase n=1 Tax=Stratiformator vulcanicus TaxID=2527980 RepID=A0A517QWX1_9PLAN|nr:transketolase C-terminal domain-containing protein [Stratiformator vulcanicus]QDT36083.1 Transketolase [Stratiformator vulcanicus]
MSTATAFPIDLDAFQPLPLDPSSVTLTDEQRETLEANIQLCRDAIVFFTAVGGARGVGGHTGGAYDTVPEVMIAYSFMLHAKEGGQPGVVPIFFDEAGHRVATQYLMAALEGELDYERLLHYREFDAHLPGHPERNFTPGVKISSGRLGHMWPYANGVAMANPDSVVFLLGSDGSQMEGNDAEAARLAVSENLNIKLLVDDNDVTIAGHPSNYMKGYDVAATLQGHGLDVNTGKGEDLDDLYSRMCAAVTSEGPVALINKRPMAPGIEGIEGSTHGHDVIPTDAALTYLKGRGLDEAVAFLESVEKGPSQPKYRGSGDMGKNRSLFGKIVNELLDGMSEEDRVASVRVFDNDLEGSCGLDSIRKEHPEVFVRGGIMERGNFSAAAGFGYEEGKQGIYATFSAFLEMIISEVTMARMNYSNVLCHFSHSGCDQMADNSCHFGINSLFADGGIEELDEHHPTRLYFPADQHQLRSCLNKIFFDPGLRFLFSNRAPVPDLLDEDGNLIYGDGYEFVAGKDDVIREGTAGYVVSFGETVYRALDAVIGLKEEGLDVGLINKSTLNIYDEAMMAKLAKAPFVMVAEGYNVKTGLGSRFGSQLLKRGFTGKYDYIGVHREGSGGLWQQMGYQGLDPEGIARSVKELVG